MPVLSRRELAATALIAVLVGVYLVFLAVGNFLDLREMTALTLIFTGSVILLLTDDEQSPAVSWFSTLIAVPAVVCATLSLLSPSVLLLTISIATTSTLWSVHIAEHLTFEPPGEARNDHHDSAATARRGGDGTAGALPS